MGMALGFLGSSILSATFLSPWLGGWRPVLFLYGGVGVVFSAAWYLSRALPARAMVSGVGANSVRRNLAHVIKIRSVWLFGLALLGFNGCIQGALGYLPLYLRGQGWAESSADGALATFHTLSMICVVPIALLSDRLGSRKKILIVATMMMALGIGGLSVAQGAYVWLAVGFAGIIRDGFMAVFFTAMIETEGVAPRSLALQWG